MLSLPRYLTGPARGYSWFSVLPSWCSWEILYMYIADAPNKTSILSTTQSNCWFQSKWVLLRSGSLPLLLAWTHPFSDLECEVKEKWTSLSSSIVCRLVPYPGSPAGIAWSGKPDVDWDFLSIRKLFHSSSRRGEEESGARLYNEYEYQAQGDPHIAVRLDPDWNLSLYSFLRLVFSSWNERSILLSVYFPYLWPFRALRRVGHLLPGELV